MSASIAGRSTILRAFYRAGTTKTTAPRISRTTCLPNSIRPNCSSTSSSSSLRLVRRELSSLEPLHSCIASACLVSKLPNLAASSSEGRFVNYLSPI